MDKKRIELIITALLVLVFLFTFGKSVAKIRPKRPAFGTSSSAAESPAAPPESLFKLRKAEEKRGIAGSELSWGRDPFMLYGGSEGEVDTVANLKLMGITIGKGANPAAIINDQLVSTGSKIGKFRVLKVLSSKVIVTDGENSYELEMK